MDVTRKADYAFRMLAVLSAKPGDLVSARDIAKEAGVSYAFARTIQHELTQAGIIESQRGARGGMRLAVDADKLTLLEVVEAMQGPIELAACVEAGPDGGVCPRAPYCGFNPVWEGARELVRSYFSTVTLADAIACKARPFVDERFARPGGSGLTPITCARASAGLAASKGRKAAREGRD